MRQNYPYLTVKKSSFPLKISRILLFSLKFSENPSGSHTAQQLRKKGEKKKESRAASQHEKQRCETEHGGEEKGYRITYPERCALFSLQCGGAVYDPVSVVSADRYKVGERGYKIYKCVYNEEIPE